MVNMYTRTYEHIRAALACSWPPMRRGYIAAVLVVYVALAGSFRPHFPRFLPHVHLPRFLGLDSHMRMPLARPTQAQRRASASRDRRDGAAPGEPLRHMAYRTGTSPPLAPLQLGLGYRGEPSQAATQHTRLWRLGMWFSCPSWTGRMCSTPSWSTS